MQSELDSMETHLQDKTGRGGEYMSIDRKPKPMLSFRGEEMWLSRLIPTCSILEIASPFATELVRVLMVDQYRPVIFSSIWQLFVRKTAPNFVLAPNIQAKGAVMAISPRTSRQFQLRLLPRLPALPPWCRYPALLLSKISE
ncbi:hypothetical protein GTR04_0776 [Trichophyton interdigitale]|uniref:Uncharacterized protein n=1 Tax=Trichophyton interdigitale TaxID=101480 RepID=A0A9P4YNC0_9EURO|nr:hypothetical protein GY631_0522 [Trichophyton interdigitale]KAF3900817.1 hypothetical protein GY632_0454 [Trichophyton interdigitale]KAG8211794.1 hypothetical protein GTR04_0776 [Trichophyton interdigitale]